MIKTIKTMIKLMYMKHVKDMLLAKSSYEFSKKKKKKKKRKIKIKQKVKKKK